jgi:predicted metallopeptidase
VLVKVTRDLDAEFQGATLNIEAADCMLVMIRAPQRLTPLTMMDMATTLAHEMVHVRQLAKGIMRFAHGDVRYWKGKKYTKKTKYLDMPWEIDAFSRQEILLRRAIDK